MTSRPAANCPVEFFGHTPAAELKPFDAHLTDCRSLQVRRPAVQVHSLDAAGLVLAEPVHAARPYPSFVASAMDGYAVRLDDLPGRLRVVGDIPAGTQPDIEVRPGTAVRIMTGSVVPVGTEAVVPVEDTTLRGDHVDIGIATTPGHNIRGIGEDVQAGGLVLPTGRLVGAGQLAALVAHNVVEVFVHPRPRVAVLSTGDELVDLGEVPSPAQLIDSNGPALAAAAHAASAEVVHTGHVGDDPDQFLTALDRLPPADLVVTSGGVSAGAYDVVKAALRDRGIVFDTVAIQPGKPQAWGRLDSGAAFLGLPGNPVAALVSFELFGRAALGHERPMARAILGEPVNRSSIGKRQFRAGHLTDGVVRLSGRHQSHLIVGFARANCLVVIEEDHDSLAAGEQVGIVLLDS